MSKRPVWSWTDAVAASSMAPLTKFVCLNIARYFSSAGKGWRVSIKEMIIDTGLSNRSLATHLQLAADAKFLIIKREIGVHGQRGVTTYTPRFPDGIELAQQAELPREGASLGPSEPGSRGPDEPPSPRPSEGGSRQVLPTDSTSQNTPPTPSKTRGCALEAFQLWNEMASRAGLQQASKLTPDRERKLKARLEDFGLDGWNRALSNVERSKYLRGLEGERKWRCTLDFLLSPSGFVKVHDGNYEGAGKFGPPAARYVLPGGTAHDTGKPTAQLEKFYPGSREYEDALADARDTNPKLAKFIVERGFVKCELRPEGASA